MRFFALESHFLLYLALVMLVVTGTKALPVEESGKPIMPSRMRASRVTDIFAVAEDATPHEELVWL